MVCEAKIHHMDRPHGHAPAQNDTPRGDITLMKKALIEVVSISDEKVTVIFISKEKNLLKRTRNRHFS